MNLFLKQVPKSYKPTKYAVYVITKPNYFDDGTWLERVLNADDDTYAGVTSLKISKRFSDHKATRNGEWRQPTGPFIENNGYEFDDGCMRLIFEGTIDQCKKVEYHLRPEKNMGLNRDPGGDLKHRKIDVRLWVELDDFAQSQRLARLPLRKVY